MSLKRRPIDPVRILSMRDSDFWDCIGDEQIRAYSDGGRDWSSIAESVAKSQYKPLIFTVYPLRASYDERALTGAVSDLKAIFAAHVSAIDNTPEDLRPVLISKPGSDRAFLDPEYVDALPLAWVLDIAGYIVATGLGDTSPFSLPGTYWQERTRRLVARHAATASRNAHTTETVSDVNTSR